ncbi:hypothetical protein SAMN04489761_0137 [Tenacibaculum sp. MAR_2009_124]|uniref:DUF6058 family natural product biosynthesis protein n=1 Tax=Tenacibaculum sp. MAR_2009_124 TaxID=1250059 RepID=UPI00089B9C09|nr:DUF6058 family natural product biosynthesis protein [Tenacibaculum sp. MAR_2009_124]SEB36245.1 hypothetical protein SAMN04489761_0137 [Tenacibaculum sp. MAR_2009_124]
MKTDLEYIQENYIELSDLFDTCNISREEFNQLVENKLVPKSSYEIKTKHVITSSLGDEIVVEDVKKYYPKNTVDLVDKNRKLNNPQEFKKVFKKEFLNTFMNNKDHNFAYDGIVNKEGSIDLEKLENAFEIEWQYYLQGIYGICTLNNNAKEIASKEIAVKKLIDFINLHGETILNDGLKEELKGLNNDFNSISNVFAPYQREASSRGKYLDKMLEINSLSHLKKKYE